MNSLLHRRKTEKEKQNVTALLAVLQFFTIASYFHNSTLEEISLPTFLFFTFLLSALLLNYLQKFTTGNQQPHLPSYQWPKIAAHSVVNVCCYLNFYVSLRYIPIAKAILFFEASHYWFFFFKSMDQIKNNPLKFQSALMMVFSFIFSLLWDFLRTIFYGDLSPTSIIIGYVFLVSSIVFRITADIFLKNISNEIGFNPVSISISISAGLLSPLSFVSGLMSSSWNMSLSTIISILCTVFFDIFTTHIFQPFLQYGFDQTSRTRSLTLFRTCCIAVAFCAIFTSSSFFSALQVSEILTFILLYYGILQLQKFIPRNEDSSILPVNLNHLSKLSLFDYLLENLTKGFFKIKNLLKIVNDSNPEARIILAYLISSLIFMFVEFTLGITKFRPTLIVSSFNLLLDCTSLVIGIISSVFFQERKSRKFSYGFQRVSVVGTFMNCISLYLSVIIHVLNSFLKGFSELNGEKMMLVSVVGLIRNFVSIIVFYQMFYSTHTISQSKTHQQQDKKIEDPESIQIQIENPPTLTPLRFFNQQRSPSLLRNFSYSIQGVLLHIFTDSLKSFGVIVSLVAKEEFEWYFMEFICSLLIAVTIIYLVSPLFFETATILLQAPINITPQEYEILVSKIKEIDGVFDCIEFKIWSMSRSSQICTLKLLSKQDANLQLIYSQCFRILKHQGFEDILLEISNHTSHIFPL